MGINLISPTTFTTSVLIGDTGSVVGGPKDSTPSLTKVNGVPVNAALEVQSTTGGLVLPRMTTAQINAITTPVAGMMAYNSTLNSPVFYQNGAWGGLGGVASTVVNLTRANILAMHGAAVQILPAPGAGLAIIVKSFSLNYIYANATAYINGDVINLQYSNAAYNANLAASSTIAAAALTSANNTLSYASGAASINSASAINAPICLTNATVAFANGGANSNLAVTVWYSIVATV